MYLTVSKMRLAAGDCCEVQVYVTNMLYSDRNNQCFSYRFSSLWSSDVSVTRYDGKTRQKGELWLGLGILTTRLGLWKNRFTQVEGLR